jgi:hypothetical protein
VLHGSYGSALIASALFFILMIVAVTSGSRATWRFRAYPRR